MMRVRRVGPRMNQGLIKKKAGRNPRIVAPIGPHYETLQFGSTATETKKRGSDGVSRRPKYDFTNNELQKHGPCAKAQYSQRQELEQPN